MMASHPEKSAVFRFEGFEFDRKKYSLVDPIGTQIPLLPKALEVLSLLISRSGETLTKEELLEAVWPDTVVEENNLTQAISMLRKAFQEKPGENRFIVTVPGRGYRFVANVEPIEGETPDAAGAIDPAEVIAPPSASRWAFSRTAIGVLIAAILFAGLYAITSYLGGTSDPDAGLPLRSVAVLPFKPLVETDRNEAMEMGMAETLITRLGDVRSLSVRPLSATRRFASVDQDPVAAGRDLRADVVIDGSIQLSGERMRVVARMFNTEDGLQLRAWNFDEPASDLFRVQDLIARRIAAELNRPIKDRSSGETNDLEAYELYMQGRIHQSRLIMPEIQKAILLYEKAILADPNYALPHYAIAESQRSLVMSNDVRPAEVIPRAKIAIQRAIELDPDSAFSRTELAMIYFFYDWAWADAEREFISALEADPNNARARIFHAHLLSNLGNKEEALSEAARARTLDPVNAFYAALHGQFLNHLGENQKALDVLRSAAERDPDLFLARLTLGSALSDVGQDVEAIVEFEKTKELSPLQSQSDAFKAVALARLNRHGEAREVLNGLLALEKERYVPPVNIAMAFAAVGETDRAIEYLQKGFEGRDPRMLFVKVERKWDGIRADPRFQDILRRMGLG